MESVLYEDMRIPLLKIAAHPYEIRDSSSVSENNEISFTCHLALSHPLLSLLCIVCYNPTDHVKLAFDWLSISLLIMSSSPSIGFLFLVRLLISSDIMRSGLL